MSLNAVGLVGVRGAKKASSLGIIPVFWDNVVTISGPQ